MIQREYKDSEIINTKFSSVTKEKIFFLGKNPSPCPSFLSCNCTITPWHENSPYQETILHPLTRKMKRTDSIPIHDIVA